MTVWTAPSVCHSPCFPTFHTSGWHCSAWDALACSAIFTFVNTCFIPPLPPHTSYSLLPHHRTHLPLPPTLPALVLGDTTTQLRHCVAWNWLWVSTAVPLPSHHDRALPPWRYRCAHMFNLGVPAGGRWGWRWLVSGMEDRQEFSCGGDSQQQRRKREEEGGMVPPCTLVVPCYSWPPFSAGPAGFPLALPLLHFSNTYSNLVHRAFYYRNAKRGRAQRYKACCALTQDGSTSSKCLHQTRAASPGRVANDSDRLLLTCAHHRYGSCGVSRPY